MALTSCSHSCSLLKRAVGCQTYACYRKKKKKEKVGKESKLIWKDRRKKLGFKAVKVTLSMLFLFLNVTGWVEITSRSCQRYHRVAYRSWSPLALPKMQTTQPQNPAGEQSGTIQVTPEAGGCNLAICTSKTSFLFLKASKTKMYLFYMYLVCLGSTYIFRRRSEGHL